MSVGQDINSKIQIGVLDIYGFECFKDNRYFVFRLFVIYRSSFPLLCVYMDCGVLDKQNRREMTQFED